MAQVDEGGVMDVKPSVATGYTLFDTAFGVCGIAWSGRGVVRVHLPEDTPETTESRLRRLSACDARMKPPPPVAAAIDAIRAYFLGSEERFASVRLDLAGVSEFDRRIYQTLRELPWGTTTTYGDLGRRIGAPGSARAVGRAMAKNPAPVIIPCHRVLAAGDRMGGFSAHGGTLTKQRMLALEHTILPL